MLILNNLYQYKHGELFAFHRFSVSDEGREEQDSTTMAKDHQNVLGHCILSDKDKMIQPDAFKVTPYDEEYIENQCQQRQTEDETCSYELYSNSTFIYGEIKVIGLNQKEVTAPTIINSLYH